jgi:cytochrome b
MDAAWPPATRAILSPTMNHPRSAVRVWDLPTRVFHWSLACCVVGSVVSAKIGGNAMVWHFRMGYAVAALLLFRLVWGLIGGRWSRFASFVYAPGTLLAYWRGKDGPHGRWDVGHSPLGALSVFALLGLALLQVATGLVSDDDISNIGPLNRFVSNAIASRATSWHHDWGQWFLLGAVALHVAAIVYYTQIKMKDLIGPMMHGDKTLPAADARHIEASRDTAATRLLALLVFAACAGLMAWVSSLAI